MIVLVCVSVSVEVISTIFGIEVFGVPLGRICKTIVTRASDIFLLWVWIDFLMGASLFFLLLKLYCLCTSYIANS